MNVYGILLAIFATSCRANWVLEANVEEVDLGSTRDVKLICKWNNATGDALTPSSLSRIRISRLDEFCSKKTFVDVRYQTDEVIKVDDTVRIRRNANPEVDPFVEVTWLVASNTTVGAYACEVDGFSMDQNFATVKVSPTVIKEHILTIQDVNKLIETATQSYLKKINNLELENRNLKKFIFDNIQDLNKEISSQNTSIRTEISENKRDIDAHYVKKDDLARQVSSLKNFTLNEVMKDNRNDEVKHEQIYTKIRETEESCSANYSKSATAVENLKHVLNNQLQTLQQSHKESIARVDSRLAALTSQISQVNIKYQNITDDIETKMSMCTCTATETTKTPSPSTSKPSTTRSSTTASTPKQTPTDKDPIIKTTPPPPSPPTTQQRPKTPSLPADPDKWPEGTYALVKPGTGCPDPKRYSDNGRHVFEVKSSNIFSTEPHPIHESEFHVRDIVLANAEFCWKNGAFVSNEPTWPAGSYCINEYGGHCPQGFGSGFLHFSHQHGPKKSYLVKFCCREDGETTTPMRLPTEKPFYLYRFRGTCQQVDGMDLESGYQYVQTSGNLELTGTISGQHADTYGHKPHIKIFLCHYHPKI